MCTLYQIMYARTSFKGLFHMHGSGVRQRRAAAAAATYITIYGIIITGLLPYMFKWVGAAAAARRCRVYGKGPLESGQCLILGHRTPYKAGVCSLYLGR